MLVKRNKMWYSVSQNTQGRSILDMTWISLLKLLLLCRYGGYGSPGWGFGVRNFLFSDFDTITSVKTWVRMEDGETKSTLDLNSSFDPKLESVQSS